MNAEFYRHFDRDTVQIFLEIYRQRLAMLEDRLAQTPDRQLMIGLGDLAILRRTSAMLEDILADHGGPRRRDRDQC